jgi:hypothetical protein
MKLTRSLPALALALTALAGTAAAQTQTVTYSVSAINEMSVSGSPGALDITTAVAGSAPTSASDATTTWAITSNQTDTKVQAAINTAMPTGVTLSLTLGAPTGATSTGAVALGTIAADMVTGITKLNESAKTITYNLAATTAAGVVASADKTVTYTVVAGT